MSCYTMLHLLLVIFFGSVTLIGRAQNDFFQFDTNFPSRTLFPFVDGTVFNIKDLVDDGSIQRVVTILQSNIKQWSFIESQLLEPNVNLGMPEIFIPLRHLTTTLEVLGNILFMRDDIQEAKSSLERACPLMELLPASVNEDHRFAVGCFALLREVYGKLYSIRDGGNRELLGIDSEGNDDNDACSVTDDDPDVIRDMVKDRDRFDDEDEGGRRRGRRRRRKRGKLHSYSQPQSIHSVGGGGHSHLEFERDDGDDLALHTSFDIDRRFEDLRSPYDHLRAELQLQQRQENHQPAPQIMYKEGAGLATATADLDALVQRFVFEDNAGRLKLFRMAKDYHEAMTVHMAANPQLVNGLGRDLDIVLVYVEVLSKVNTEGGFDFISRELSHFNLAVAAPEGEGGEVVGEMGGTDGYPMEGIAGGGVARMAFDEDGDVSPERDIDVDDDDEDDVDDDDDDYIDEYEDEGMYEGDQGPVEEGIEVEAGDDIAKKHRIMLVKRIGSMSLHRSKSGGRSISGAGRIRRYSGNVDKLSKSQSPKVVDSDPDKVVGKDLSAESQNKGRVRPAAAVAISRKSEGSDDGLPYDGISAAQTGLYRSAHLSPAERNRFMVLNAFERALNENPNPSNPQRDRDRDREGDSSGTGGIHGSRGGKTRDNLGRDRWSGYNFEKDRDRDSSAKMFESAATAEDKLMAFSDSLASIIITLTMFLILVLVAVIVYLATHRRSKPQEQANGHNRSRWSKSRTYTEYFLSQLPLPASVAALLGSLLGVEHSRLPSADPDTAASASNIDDSVFVQGKGKKDGRRSGRGDYRERDAHRLVPTTPVENTGKDGDSRGFFSELQGVLTSIWKELSSSVVPSAALQAHTAAAVSTKVKNASSSVSHNGLSSNAGQTGVATGSGPSACPALSPVVKQTLSKASSSKKEKGAVNASGKSKHSAAPAASEAPKKSHAKPKAAAAAVNSPASASATLSIPSSTTAEDSSGDSETESDGEKAMRSRISGTVDVLKGLAITVVAVDPVDDDAGYSRYVRKGAVNANKTAAAAAAAAAAVAAASAVTAAAGGRADPTRPIPNPSPNPNGAALHTPRTVAALSMAPMVDAATVAQQRAALQYYEALKEKEKARQAALAKGHPPQQQSNAPSTPVPPAWSTAASRAGIPAKINPAGMSHSLPSKQPIAAGNGSSKGPNSQHTYASSAPKGMTYASVAQNSGSTSSSGLYDTSSFRITLNSSGSSSVSADSRAESVHTAPVVAPASSKVEPITSNPHSASNSCPSSPGTHSVRRASGGPKGGRVQKEQASGGGGEMSPTQGGSGGGQHSAYLRAREQASDQLQQQQLMSDLRSLSVRPEEGISSPSFVSESFLSGQQQISQSLSSSFDGTRSHLQSQFGGLVGYLSDAEGERGTGRERERERDDLLAADISDTIGDMDIGTIDLSFALASDLDADADTDADMSAQTDALYSSGAKQHTQIAYDYRGLSQYSNGLAQTHAQTQQLSCDNHMHNLYLATGDIDDGSAQSYSQSPYSYTDYSPVMPPEDMDRSVPRARGYSSVSQLDFIAQSQSGLSPNAPSFNPNTLSGMWRGLPAQTQSPSAPNPFEQPHGLMETELNMEYAANMDFNAHLQQQQLQHHYYQESLTQQQSYDAHFSPYMTHPQTSHTQIQQHQLSMYYPQADQLHQSLPLPPGSTPPVGLLASTPISSYVLSPTPFNTLPGAGMSTGRLDGRSLTITEDNFHGI